MTDANSASTPYYRPWLVEAMLSTAIMVLNSAYAFMDFMSYWPIQHWLETPVPIQHGWLELILYWFFTVYYFIFRDWRVGVAFAVAFVVTNHTPYYYLMLSIFMLTTLEFYWSIAWKRSRSKSSPPSSNLPA